MHKFFYLKISFILVFFVIIFSIFSCIPVLQEKIIRQDKPNFTLVKFTNTSIQNISVVASDPSKVTSIKALSIIDPKKNEVTGYLLVPTFSILINTPELRQAALASVKLKLELLNLKKSGVPSITPGDFFNIIPSQQEEKTTLVIEDPANPSQTKKINFIKYGTSSLELTPEAGINKKTYTIVISSDNVFGNKSFDSRTYVSNEQTNIYNTFGPAITTPIIKETDIVLSVSGLKNEALYNWHFDTTEAINNSDEIEEFTNTPKTVSNGSINFTKSDLNFSDNPINVDKKFILFLQEKNSFVNPLFTSVITYESQNIYTTQDFNSVRHDLLRNYKLVNNIDFAALKEDFLPIGSSNNPFNGSLTSTIVNDTQNQFSLKNLNITHSINNSIGIFSYISTNGKISNIILDSLEVINPTNENNGSTGALAGINYGKISSVLLKDSKVFGSTNVGGLVGNNYSTIEYVGVSNSVITGKNNVGGLIGSHLGNTNNTLDKISGYVEQSDISVENAAENTNSQNIGGLIGKSNSTSENIIVGYLNDTSVIAPTSINVGGLIGQADSTNLYGYIKDGTIIGHDYIGGLVGLSQSEETHIEGYVRSQIAHDRTDTQTNKNISYIIGQIKPTPLNNITPDNYRGYFSSTESSVNQTDILIDSVLGTSIRINSLSQKDIFSKLDFTKYWTWVSNGTWPALTALYKADEMIPKNKTQPVERSDDNIIISDAPFPVRSIQVVSNTIAQNGNIKLQWTSPASSRPIDTYDILIKTQNSNSAFTKLTTTSTPVALKAIPPNTLQSEAEITGLSPYINYEIQVLASNIQGSSKPNAYTIKASKTPSINIVPQENTNIVYISGTPQMFTNHSIFFDIITEPQSDNKDITFGLNSANDTGKTDSNIVDGKPIYVYHAPSTINPSDINNSHKEIKVKASFKFSDTIYSKTLNIIVYENNPLIISAQNNKDYSQSTIYLPEKSESSTNSVYHVFKDIPFDLIVSEQKNTHLSSISSKTSEDIFLESSSTPLSENTPLKTSVSIVGQQIKYTATREGNKPATQNFHSYPWPTVTITSKPISSLAPDEETIITAKIQSDFPSFNINTKLAWFIEVNNQYIRLDDPSSTENNHTFSFTPNTYTGNLKLISFPSFLLPKQHTISQNSTLENNLVQIIKDNKHAVINIPVIHPNDISIIKFTNNNIDPSLATTDLILVAEDTPEKYEYLGYEIAPTNSYDTSVIWKLALDTSPQTYITDNTYGSFSNETPISISPTKTYNVVSYTPPQSLPNNKQEVTLFFIAIASSTVNNEKPVLARKSFRLKARTALPFISITSNMKEHVFEDTQVTLKASYKRLNEENNPIDDTILNEDSSVSFNWTHKTENSEQSVPVNKNTNEEYIYTFPKISEGQTSNTVTITAQSVGATDNGDPISITQSHSFIIYKAPQITISDKNVYKNTDTYFSATVNSDYPNYIDTMFWFQKNTNNSYNYIGVSNEDKNLIYKNNMDFTLAAIPLHLFTLIAAGDSPLHTLYNNVSNNENYSHNTQTTYSLNEVPTFLKAEKTFTVKELPSIKIDEYTDNNIISVRQGEDITLTARIIPNDSSFTIEEQNAYSFNWLTSNQSILGTSKNGESFIYKTINLQPGNYTITPVLNFKTNSNTDTKIVKITKDIQITVLKPKLTLDIKNSIIPNTVLKKDNVIHIFSGLPINILAQGINSSGTVSVYYSSDPNITDVPPSEKNKIIENEQINSPIKFTFNTVTEKTIGKISLYKGSNTLAEQTLNLAIYPLPHFEYKSFDYPQGTTLTENKSILVFKNINYKINAKVITDFPNFSTQLLAIPPGRIIYKDDSLFRVRGTVYNSTEDIVFNTKASSYDFIPKDFIPETQENLESLDSNNSLQSTLLTSLRFISYLNPIPITIKNKTTTITEGNEITITEGDSLELSANLTNTSTDYKNYNRSQIYFQWTGDNLPLEEKNTNGSNILLPTQPISDFNLTQVKNVTQPNEAIKIDTSQFKPGTKKITVSYYIYRDFKKLNSFPDNYRGVERLVSRTLTINILSARLVVDFSSPSAPDALYNQTINGEEITHVFVGTPIEYKVSNPVIGRENDEVAVYVPDFTTPNDNTDFTILEGTQKHINTQQTFPIPPAITVGYHPDGSPIRIPITRPSLFTAQLKYVENNKDENTFTRKFMVYPLPRITLSANNLNTEQKNSQNKTINVINPNAIKYIVAKVEIPVVEINPATGAIISDRTKTNPVYFPKPIKLAWNIEKTDIYKDINSIQQQQLTATEEAEDTKNKQQRFKFTMQELNTVTLPNNPITFANISAIPSGLQAIESIKNKQTTFDTIDVVFHKAKLDLFTDDNQNVNIPNTIRTYNGRIHVLENVPINFIAYKTSSDTPNFNITLYKENQDKLYESNTALLSQTLQDTQTPNPFTYTFTDYTFSPDLYTSSSNVKGQEEILQIFKTPPPTQKIIGQTTINSSANSPKVTVKVHRLPNLQVISSPYVSGNSKTIIVKQATTNMPYVKNNVQTLSWYRKNNNSITYLGNSTIIDNEARFELTDIDFSTSDKIKILVAPQIFIKFNDPNNRSQDTLPDYDITNPNNNTLGLTQEIIIEPEPPLIKEKDHVIVKSSLNDEQYYVMSGIPITLTLSQSTDKLEIYKSVSVNYVGPNSKPLESEDTSNKYAFVHTFNNTYYSPQKIFFNIRDKETRHNHTITFYVYKAVSVRSININTKNAEIGSALSFDTTLRVIGNTRRDLKVQNSDVIFYKEKNGLIINKITSPYTTTSEDIGRINIIAVPNFTEEYIIPNKAIPSFIPFSRVSITVTQ